MTVAGRTARRTLYAEPRLRLHREGTAPGLGPYALRLAGGLYRQFVNRFEASSTSPTAILPSMRFWLPTGSAHAPPRVLHGTTQVQLQPHDRWTVQGEAFYKHYGRLLALDYGALWTPTEPPVADSVAAKNGYALGGGESRWRSAALTYTGQVSLTHTVAERVGLAVEPGLTLNPNETLDDEDPLVTLGLGARWKVREKVAIVGKWTPILSGPNGSARSTRYDTWAAGGELTTAGHVFQVVASNGLGLTTDQYLAGADLAGNVFDGNVRLGFNIFRILDFSKL